ncbi:MAG: transketolase family protein [Luteimonas sp.]
MRLKLADHMGLALAELAQQDARVFVLDGDLADSDGAVHFALRHPERFLMAGIAEQGMVSTAAGMAEAGLRPFVFSFAAFLCYRAFDQARVCLSQSLQPVTLVGSHAGGLSGRNGKTHAAPNDLALMLSLPNVDVWAPADEQDARLAAREILAGDRPAYVRTPRRPFAADECLPGEARALRWILPKRPLSLVATGLATHWALAAARELQAQGVDVGLLHCARLKPLPPLEHELDGVECTVVVEDHSRFGGLASLLATQMPARPMNAFGWPLDFVGRSGADDELLAHYGLNGPALAQAIRGLSG